MNFKGIILHILLGIVLVGCGYTILTHTNIINSSIIYTCWFIYWREVQQHQTALYSNNFLKGWNIFNWSSHKLQETIVPIISLCVIGIFLNIGMQ